MWSSLLIIDDYYLVATEISSLNLRKLQLPSQRSLMKSFAKAYPQFVSKYIQNKVLLI